MNDRSPRRFVIGDVHGCSKALRELIRYLDPGEDDELVFLGDYVDRGPDSRDVIEQLIALQQRSRVVALRGNHEVMLGGILFGDMPEQVWMNNGGHATVTSYGGRLDRIPETHREFLRSLHSHYETETEIFVHAGYHPDLAMAEIDDVTRYWQHLAYPLPQPHRSGKRVYVGHTPQPGGRILDANHLICVDTCCFGGGYLTAMDRDDGRLVQFDSSGHRRRQPLAEMFAAVRRLF